MDELLGFFITIRTYGTWMHGDERGSVDRFHNEYGTPFLSPDAAREEASRERMTGEPYVMGDREREVVRAAIEETCRHRAWHVWALNVRTNHVHVVLSASKHSAERVMGDLKAYATRALRREALVTDDRQLWSKHGSTPHLYTPDQLMGAIEYVTLMQDGPQSS